MADQKPPDSPVEPGVKAEPVAAKKGAGKPKFALPVLRPREKVIFYFFLFMISVVVVDFALIQPVGNYLKQLDETIKLQEEVIPKQLRILKYKDHILFEYRSIKPFYVADSVSQEEETAQFLREIEKVSKEVNFFVTNINPVQVNKRSDSISEMSMDV